MGSRVNRHFIRVDGGTLHLCDLSRMLLAASVPVCQVQVPSAPTSPAVGTGDVPSACCGQSITG